MKQLKQHLFQPISIAPLAIFRVLFGFMMLISIIRFAYYDWIQIKYIQPQFFFTYYGFDWVVPLSSNGMNVLFIIMGLCALLMMLGWFYRAAAVLFFLLFSYVELIDKTNYLNHYYFVSLISFWLMLVPANRYFSLDVLFSPQSKKMLVPAWTIGIFKFQLAVVYFYAGLAKLNYDWLVLAMPLKIWLPAKSDLPLLGSLFQYKWSAHLFSWGGALYDLCIPFLLLIRSTRLLAYMAVLGFHLMTAMLFQIGMFPYIMILSTLIFFPAPFHQKLIDGIGRLLRLPKEGFLPQAFPNYRENNFITVALGLYLILQVLIPFRYVLYPGNLFWNEQGYRFSWRVMLMEKAGYVVFHIHDPITGKTEQANNYDYLTKFQEKQMSTQPDMILQFAHHLERVYRNKGFVKPQITAESYVTLNGRRSKTFIDPQVDLTEVRRGYAHKDWVLPFEEKKK